MNVLVPDRITTWIGRGFCTNPKHGAGVSDVFPLRVFQPYNLELELPPSVIRGEKVPVNVLVFEYLPECMVVSENDEVNFFMFFRKLIFMWLLILI